MTSPSLLDRVRAGDVRALARAISLVEDDVPGAAAMVGAAHSRAAAAVSIGVTGAPGAGKSTLVDRLITEYRKAGERVAVLAVDPTSPFTGGAILGDRVRMASHATDPGALRGRRPTPRYWLPRRASVS
jgi:LAO/AO transport system kinase